MFTASTSTSVPEWLQITAASAPLVTLLATLVAAVIALVTLMQRHRAAKRDQWWKRAQWAMNLAIEGDMPAKEIGVRALKQLGESKLLAREEEEFLYHVGAAVQDVVIDTAAEEADNRRKRILGRRR